MSRTRRSILRLALIAGITATAFGFASAPRAGGGIFLTVDIPRADSDPRLKEMDFIVRTLGCAGPGATITITAEGLVDGKRISQAVTPVVVPPAEGVVGTPTLGVRRSWPLEGSWIVAIDAQSVPYDYAETKNGKPTGRTLQRYFQQSVVVPILPDGTPEIHATPGAKYDSSVRYIRTTRSDQEKKVRQFLSPVPAIAQAKTR